ncbi:substrate-binding domain-containing protein [Paenibacillus kobensis]|uniref:substrate-binding domain-containing protein n=1 Tax=Paenibacillus kobensis TaxID=59841 RepID=UPI000FD913AC|nr:helix-turn-helix transcriptional regulator [Paenibacillus kobensis]
MSQDVSYTAEEIAALLKISKLTVYDLIKKGLLPSYRVGKQMRVDASDLEAYKQRSKTSAAASASAAAALSAPSAASALSPPSSSDLTLSGHISANAAGSAAPAPAGHTSGAAARSVVITGQDMSLDLLAKHMEGQASGSFRPLRSYVGSLDSLISMYRGESDIVSTHLLDGDTGEYNLPYVRRLLVGFPYLVVNLLSRNAGLYVAKGNPRGIRGWADLEQPGLRLVNRERGSGARVLLDEQLRLHGIKPAQLAGYAYEQTNHWSVAAAVASGGADIGVGTERAASIVGGVDFIPLIKERYDLVVMKKDDNQAMIDSLLNILASKPFKQELQALSGYDLSMTGNVLLEN